MPIKDPAKRRDNHARYMREVWYPRNKPSHVKLVKERKDRTRKELRAKVQALKESYGCIDCGNSDHRVLDFDHVTGRKRFGIAQAVTQCRSWEVILEEIGECEVRCANCHRIKTLLRRR